MIMFIYSLIFITVNFFILKVNQKICFKKLIQLIVFVFLIIVIIGKTYDILYIKDMMMKKKTFIIILLFSWGILPLSLINIYNNSRLNERLTEQENSDFFSKPDIPIYTIVLTILITVFQLIIIWNDVKFPND